MKIEFPSTLPDRSAAGAGGDLVPAARREAGRGFADAVRGVGARRESARDADAAAEEAPAAEGAGIGEGEDAPLSDASRDGRRTEEGQDPLRLVLDLIGASPRGAAEAADATPAPDEPAPRDGAPALPGAADGAEATVPDGEDARRPLRLDVLRMETHFEPRQDGVAEAANAKANAAKAGAAEAAARPPAPPAGREAPASPEASLAAAAARSAPPAVPPVAAAAAAGQDVPGERVPVRFEEAVARLASPMSATSSSPAATSPDVPVAPSSAPVRPSPAGEAGQRSADGQAGDKRENRAVAARARGEAPVSAKGSDAALPSAETARSGGASAAGDAPPQTGGIAAQVAGRITQALGDAAPASAPGSAAPGSRQAEAIEGHLRLRAGGAARRTLTLQLQPEHLGTLEVSMRLRDGQLALEISASRPETAAALADDQAALRKLLETAGFTMDEGAINITVRDAGAGVARPADGQATGDGRSSGNAPGNETAGRGPGEEGGGRRESGAGGGERRSPSRDEARPSAAGRGSSTYL